MRSSFGITTLFAVLLCALVGCASSLEAQGELTEDSVNQNALADNASAMADNASAMADNASAMDDAYSYFGLAADIRRCPSPSCGGWYLTSLNRSTTKCHDGQAAQVCYTPVLDWSESNLSEAQQATLFDACSKDPTARGVYAIVRGRFERSNHTTPHPELGRFVVSEAWVAEGDTVSAGTFVRVRDNGRRCIAAPCPSLTEDTLNQAQPRDLAGVDWAPARLSEPRIAECVQAMSTPDGVLVAGHYYTMHGRAGSALGRTATAAYYRLTAP
jgi:hypothetical protein